MSDGSAGVEGANAAARACRAIASLAARRERAGRLWRTGANCAATAARSGAIREPAKAASLLSAGSLSSVRVAAGWHADSAGAAALAVAPPDARRWAADIEVVDTVVCLHGGSEMIGEWVANKPTVNDGSLPTLLVDHKDMPKIAEGIWHAQMAGWERILTYDHVETPGEKRRQRSAKRRENFRAGFQRCGLTMDEYPFACTKENAGSTFLTNAPQEEQTTQGRQLNDFLRDNGAYTKHDGYFYFEVKVVNYLPSSVRSG